MKFTGGEFYHLLDLAFWEKERYSCGFIKRRRMYYGLRLIFIFSVFVVSESYASSILLHTNDAVVWHPEQRITGELSGFAAEEMIVHHNQLSFSVNVTDRKFSFELILQDLKNKIWVEACGDSVIISDTLHYELGYNPGPIVKPFATVTGDKAILHGTIIENPYKASLQYLWVADSLNPALCQIINKDDSIASVEIPDKVGIYNFNLLIIAEATPPGFKHLLNVINKESNPSILIQVIPSGWTRR
jgi:hypothetical protein